MSDGKELFTDEEIIALVREEDDEGEMSDEDIRKILKRLRAGEVIRVKAPGEHFEAYFFAHGVFMVRHIDGGLVETELPRVCVAGAMHDIFSAEDKW